MVLQVYLSTISALSPTRCLKPGAFFKTFVFWCLVNRKRLRITLIGDKKKINQSPVELNDQQLQYPEYRCLMLTYRRILFFCQSRFSEVEVELSYLFRYLDLLSDQETKSEGNPFRWQNQDILWTFYRWEYMTEGESKISHLLCLIVRRTMASRRTAAEFCQS